MTLVPAFFTLLREKTWYIPRWLDRLLPNITIEPPHEREAHWHRSAIERPAGETGAALTSAPWARSLTGLRP